MSYSAYMQTLIERAESFAQMERQDREKRQREPREPGVRREPRIPGVQPIIRDGGEKDKKETEGQRLQRIDRQRRAQEGWGESIECIIRPGVVPPPKFADLLEERDTEQRKIWNDERKDWEPVMETDWYTIGVC